MGWKRFTASQPASTNSTSTTSLHRAEHRPAGGRAGRHEWRTGAGTFWKDWMMPHEHVEPQRDHRADHIDRPPRPRAGARTYSAIQRGQPAPPARSRPSSAPAWADAAGWKKTKPVTLVSTDSGQEHPGPAAATSGFSASAPAPRQPAEDGDQGDGDMGEGQRVQAQMRHGSLLEIWRSKMAASCPGQARA